MEKKCNKCNVVKDVSEFNKAINNKDGLRNECKACMKKYKQKHYEANKKSINKKKNSARAHFIITRATLRKP